VVIQEIPIGSYDPTPAAIRSGRGFLYDAKLSGNGTMSCASCHVDAEMDLLAWDLGDPTGTMVTNQIINVQTGPPIFVTNASSFHPMKGPMVTQTLRGLNGLDPFHWRGDRTNFLAFNPAFATLLGGSALSNTDMTAYRDFINTITFEPNPNQNLDRTYPTNLAGGDATVGRTFFLFSNYNNSIPGLTCNSCHTAPPGPGTDSLILSRVALSASQDIKMPHLRNQYQKLDFNTNGPSIAGFGFNHDGTIPTEQAFFSQNLFPAIQNNTTVKNNLTAFMLSFDTGTAPAVGYTRTITATNENTASISNDWSLLESQAALTNVDLIAKGTLNGQRHGLLYQPAQTNYVPDTTNLPAFTHAQLMARIQAGDTLSFMGVPPGSGVRMGIDRNSDGVRDSDEPPPGLQIAQSAGNLVVQWPLGAAGYLPEYSTNLAPTSWTSVTDAVFIAGAQNCITNPPAGDAIFYRLNLPLP